MDERLYDRALLITYATVSVLLIILGVVMYSLLTDFSPMKATNVSPEPKVVCPAQLVEANGDLDIDEGKYMLIIDPAWRNVDTGVYWDIAEAGFPIEGPIKTENRTDSDVVYQAPTVPGKWEFDVILTITGRNGILPRKQVITDSAEGVTTVADCGDAYTYEEFKRGE